MQKSKQVIKVVSLVKMAENVPDVSSPFKERYPDKQFFFLHKRISFMLFNEIQRFLCEIQFSIFTVSNRFSNIHCLGLPFVLKSNSS